MLFSCSLLVAQVEGEELIIDGAGDDLIIDGGGDDLIIDGGGGDDLIIDGEEGGLDEAPKKPIDPKKAAEDYVKNGDIQYNFGAKRNALEVYLLAYESDPGNVRANFMAGICYLETIHKPRGLKYFQKAYELDHEYDPKLLYYIAECQHFKHDFDNAIIYYKKYKKKVEQDFEDRKISKEQREFELEDIERKLYECANGNEFIDNHVHVKIKNMGGKINKAFPDYTPAISGDGKLLMFTSRRSNSTGGLVFKDLFHFEDVYYSTWNEEKNRWNRAKNIGAPINTESHDAVISISSDGNELFIYRDAGNGDIFKSYRNNDNSWTKPVPIKEVNTGAFENHLTSSVEGDMYIFSSNRKGGVGDVQNLDLWMVKINDKGKWGKPKNLGKKINTEAQEDTPFLDADGTLYFSSRGHKGMGGFDIFKTKYNEKTDEWSDPENIGYPINTADDDYAFILPGDGKTGYYSSFKDGGKGEKDLYEIDMDPPYEFMTICYQGKEKKIDKVWWEEWRDRGAVKGSCEKDIKICLSGEDMTIKESEWPVFQDQGAFQGTCAEDREIVICHNGENIQIMLSEWGEHMAHGDVKGNCQGGTDNGSRRTNIDGTNGTQGGVGNEGGNNRIVICHNGESMYIKESEWPEHQAHGDTKGQCSVVSTGGDEVISDVLLKGRVRDVISNEPIAGATVEIHDASDDRLIERITVGADGTYEHRFKQSNKRLYVIHGEAEGYMFTSERVPVPGVSKMTQTVVQDLFLGSPNVNDIKVLKNIYFDFDQSVIRRESIVELRLLERFMKGYPSAKIQVRGHTDNKGENAYNQKLSDRRASIVVKFLIRRGVSSARMVYKGFGETKPIATNDDEDEGRELNRRTEFKIVAK